MGPAGTGKTWLAVACAIDAMERDTVQRLVLTRPAVEAGERLGFLPGDLAQKVDPYLRPLYDALYDLMGFDKVQRLFEKQTIEIAPLAYMRGRTLNHAFIILDEAQNTTPEQMKMFLTRIGFGSKAVITGDPSQVDLPRGQDSGLAHAVRCCTTCRASPPPASPAATSCATRWWPASWTPTTVPQNMTPDLSLSVQYAADEPRLPRWRLRRWAERALAAAAEDGLVDFSAAELSLRLVGAAEGKRLNRDFRGRDYATNVLTFEYGVDPLGVAGRYRDLRAGAGARGARAAQGLPAPRRPPDPARRAACARLRPRQGPRRQAHGSAGNRHAGGHGHHGSLPGGLTPAPSPAPPAARTGPGRASTGQP